MFVQVIQGTVDDADLLRSQVDRWRRELKPGATGYLGSTSGITADGRSITMVRFESEEAGRANSDRPEQAAWWSETAKALGSDVTFQNCREVDTLFGGGSDAAGFVQVIQGRAKDESRMRTRLGELQPALRERRPDIVGIVIGWHGDGGGFTQAVYFTSEEETRAREQDTEQDDLRQEFLSMIDGQPTFFDLTEPDLD